MKLPGIIVRLELSVLLGTGAILGSGLATAAPSASETIAITEYMSDPTGSSATDEWVELYNYGTAEVSIGGWHLRDDDSDSITVPAGTKIPAASFLILARNKQSFESIWLDGEPSDRVLQYGPGTFAMSDTGADELVLTNSSGTEIWRVAYGANVCDSRATFYSVNDLTLAGWNNGTKSSVINRKGNDAATGKRGYEGCELTDDPLAYAGGRDYGSPLRGPFSGAIGNPPQVTVWAFDYNTTGTTISQGIRGLAIADQSLDRHDNSEVTGIVPSLQTARGSAIRGVAGGLYADMYDWKRRNDMPRPPTLEFQRWARDYDVELFVTANTRGLTIPVAAQPGYREYYTSDTATLAQLAADWVRYTNHITQTYRQGDTVSDPRDAAILAELTWSSTYVNEFGRADNYTTLLAPGEAPVAPVKYWEIGNEPTVSLANAYSVINAFTFADDPQEYTNRYIAITRAMLAEDPTIKVGPCVVNGRTGKNAAILSTLLQSGAQVDFISYHPYGSMNDWLNLPLGQMGYLDYVFDEQANFLGEIKALVAQYRPAQSSTMQYVASEINVSDFRTNNQFQEGTMAHALGSVETVMSFARLGLLASHYWIWITATPNYLDDSNRFCVTMAYEKMRDELGDKLLAWHDSDSRFRGYAFRDTDKGELQLWLMNFSDYSRELIRIQIANAPAGSTVKTTSLRNLPGFGNTSLFSANLSSDINGGTPLRMVDWSEPTESTTTNLADMQLTLLPASLTLITIKPAYAGVSSWPLY